ncbi:unnamed protein product [Schistosoma curassoni]|uniref:Uncharacterized protein n=1 Tax=Schistosoma curassoni TaxID=6186 RepID=A0A183K266_9TREM|nr:unnamed protein product [Schistosoma curassoni]
MYVHLRVNVHSGTRTQYRSLFIFAYHACELRLYRGNTHSMHICQ